MKALSGRDFIEFWGIEANPSIETLRKAIALGKEKRADFLLAVGGGSVIDGTKTHLRRAALRRGCLGPGTQGSYTKTVPLASVLTIAPRAPGNEQRGGDFALRNQEIRLLQQLSGAFRCLDPETLYSLPKRQIACGLADTFVHVLEQYMTTPGQSRLMDRWAEGILHTVVEIAPRGAGERTRLRHDVGYMLSATLALNDMIPHGRDAGLGDAHDRPRADGAARADARRDAGDRDQRHAAHAA